MGKVVRCEECSKVYRNLDALEDLRDNDGICLVCNNPIEVADWDRILASYEDDDYDDDVEEEDEDDFGDDEDDLDDEDLDDDDLEDDFGEGFGEFDDDAARMTAGMDTPGAGVDSPGEDPVDDDDGDFDDDD